VAIVLGPVEAEHAGSHHLGGGKPRVVDGERPRVAHRGQDEVVPRDQPALEAGQPRHRLGRTQARQRGVRILVELWQGDRGAQGKRRLPLSLYGLHDALIVPTVLRNEV
jgi:hypothetical protein